MKAKSALLLFSGITIGAIASFLFTSTKGFRSRKELSKKTKKYKKAFKETASKYKEKLANT